MHLRNTLAKGMDAESYSLHTFEALLSQSMENLGRVVHFSIFPFLLSFSETVLFLFPLILCLVELLYILELQSSLYLYVTTQNVKLSNTLSGYTHYY